MSRQSMGLVQLHQLSCVQISSLPISVWIHFMLRFALNIGDSGLHNAVMDKERSFVYGIDLDERRGKKPDCNMLDMMFVKRPAKVLCDSIIHSIKTNKDLLLNQLDKPIERESLKELMERHNITMYLSDIFKKIDLLKKVVTQI